jgi:hypothetical protein
MDTLPAIAPQIWLRTPTASEALHAEQEACQFPNQSRRFAYLGMALLRSRPPTRAARRAFLSFASPRRARAGLFRTNPKTGFREGVRIFPAH